MDLDYGERNEFKRKMNNATYAIKMLREKDVINYPTASRLLARSWEIKTMDELDKLISELAEICQKP